MIEKLRIDMPVIVEGKYDKIKLDSILDATILTTNGFGVFTSPEAKKFLHKLCEKTKIIILTDSDGAGRMIRNHLKCCLPPDRLINLYIPDIKGKEKRKKIPSKAGTLGVEGMDASFLRELFLPFAVGGGAEKVRRITKADLYEDGFLGANGSREKRIALASRLSLPAEMSSNAFLDALNLYLDYEEYREIVK